MNGFEYDMGNDLLRPLLDITSDTIKNVSSVKDVEATKDTLNGVFDKMERLSKRAPEGIPENLRHRITGVYMNRDRQYNVVGGPDGTDIVIKDGVQSIPPTAKPFQPIRIVEAK